MKKLFLFFAAMLAVVSAGSFLDANKAWPAEPAKDDRPNILFILTDDQRWDTLGVYGNRDIKTPNLDRLAKEGALFTDGYVAAPICCPARVTFLTGLYPHQTGVLTNKAGETTIPKGVRTLPQYLNDAGYLTGFVGKWHIDGDPFVAGFKEAPVYLPKGAARHFNPILMVEGEAKALPGKGRKNDYLEDEYHSRPAQEKKIEGMITPIFADAAIKFLDRHKADRFFLWLATTAPHTPYYRDPKFPYRKNDINAPPGWVDKTLSDENWEGYYSTISHMDLHLGRVLDRLRELGLGRKTVVVFTSDNGFMMGSHGRYGKATWYDESVRVPWAIRWDGKIKPGTTVKTPIVSTDFLPTVLDIAGLKIPSGYEGLSALPALKIGKGSVREVVYSEVRDIHMGERPRKDRDRGDRRGGRSGPRGGLHWQMVKTAAAKYVWTDSGKEMLFDLKKDPGEYKDVAGDQAYEKVLSEMRALHKKWLEKTPPVKR